jgi:hypothetical protein
MRANCVSALRFRKSPELVEMDTDLRHFSPRDFGAVGTTDSAGHRWHAGAKGHRRALDELAMIQILATSPAGFRSTLSSRRGGPRRGNFDIHGRQPVDLPNRERDFRASARFGELREELRHARPSD